MSVSPYSPSFFDELSAWSASRGDGPLLPDLLPPVGAVAMDTDGFKLAAAWLYQPLGCRVAIIDWLITRPGLTADASRLACQSVLAELSKQAKARGFTILFCSVSRPGMLREAEACGFTICAENVTHLFKPL